MTESISYNWKPIEDLPVNWEKLSDSQLPVITDVWKIRKEELEGSDGLSLFNEKLARRWSIETGAIEGVYSIERGTTELLIERGIEASLIKHGSTNKPAEEIVKILDDHKGALDGIFQFVKKERLLSTSYIKELHQELCASQTTVTGKDSHGTIREIPLLKGEWKKHPNNPHRKDGHIHQYCPPEQVSSEMDRLIQLHLQHVESEVPPEVEAAWLHHRFTQIHPFQDGNGRVARSLASLILLRDHLFPFIIGFESQGRYIDSLEIADHKKDLKPLVSIISKQQQQALRGALDISRDVIREQEQEESLNQKLFSIVKKINNIETQRKEKDFRTVKTKAQKLTDITDSKLSEIKKILKQNLQQADQNLEIKIYRSDDEKTMWYHYQTIQIAKELGYFANDKAWSMWIRLLVIGDFGGEIVFSFHQLGHNFKGVFICTAFFQALEGKNMAAEDKRFTNLVDEGFVISATEPEKKMKTRFNIWLEEVVNSGIDEWMKTI